MKRLRVFVVTAFAPGALELGAAPASACQPDGPCPCSERPTQTINAIWTKVTGKNPADSAWTKVFGHKVFHC